MSYATVYGGSYIVGTEMIYNYGLKKNIPRNVHDITRARMSYSPIAVNMRRLRPKSMVASVIGFADQLQITHLKIQQAIAKAKPDGLIIDVEGLENVQLGKGGDCSPLRFRIFMSRLVFSITGLKILRVAFRIPRFALLRIRLGISMSLLRCIIIIFG